MTSISSKTSLFDSDTFDQITAGDESLQRELLSLLSGELSTNRSKCDDALNAFAASGDSSPVMAHLHLLKGLARSLGGIGLADKIASAEREFDKALPDPRDARNQLRGYHDEFDLLAEAIGEHIDS